MAKKVVVTLVDDLDGSKASETVSFGLDGSSFTIDLSEKNAKKFRDLLDPYLAASTKVKGERVKRQTAKSTTGKAVTVDLAAIREWANANGFEVSPRGRVPAHVVDAYNGRK